MTDDELQGTVIPATRGPMRERADGSLQVSIVIQPTNKSAFLKLLPDVDLPIFIVRQAHDSAKRIAQDETVRQAKTMASYGRLARALRLHIGWMGNPDVWAALGSDTQYLDWCRDQPCANPNCEFVPHWEMDRWVRCEPAHVRRVADGAGVAIKPSYAAVPLCHDCHAIQHQKGESAIVGKVGFDKLRIVHVQNWAWERMRAVFGVDSMSEVSPAVMSNWARENDLLAFLPSCYVLA